MLAHPQSREVPLRYVDLNAVDADLLGLAGPVTMVPTIVLMRDGQEVSRIAGYTGPQYSSRPSSNARAQRLQRPWLPLG